MKYVIEIDVRIVKKTFKAYFAMTLNCTNTSGLNLSWAYPALCEHCHRISNC